MSPAWTSRLRILPAALTFLLAIHIARLWIVPLSSSFWVDEMVTAFVVKYPHHPSLLVAPQVTASIYYWLPRFLTHLFGSSEAVYRIPSVLAAGLALLLTARIARRLFGAGAGWFAAFACVSLKYLDYFAADARMYALGMAVSAAAVLFLIRWLDRARWTDAALFVVAAALLWRVHLLYWPFYLVFAAYAAARFIRRETPVGLTQAAVVCLTLAVALAPVVLASLSLAREAQSHVIVPRPPVRDLLHELRWNLVAISAAAAFLLGRIFRWPFATRALTFPAIVLTIGWWLLQPLTLFGYSWISGHSVFVSRYLSLFLPGLVLAMTAGMAAFVPSSCRTICALVLAVLLFVFTAPPPRHDISDWRSAAAYINQESARTPAGVLCPSPFIEARPPSWSPNYRLPGFLYAHLDYYPISARTYLLPFERGPEAERYLRSLLLEAPDTPSHLFVYGGAAAVRSWRRWLLAQPLLASNITAPSQFGNVWVFSLDRPRSR